MKMRGGLFRSIRHILFECADEKRSNLPWREVAKSISVDASQTELFKVQEHVSGVRINAKRSRSL